MAEESKRQLHNQEFDAVVDMPESVQGSLMLSLGLFGAAGGGLAQGGEGQGPNVGGGGVAAGGGQGRGPNVGGGGVVAGGGQGGLNVGGGGVAAGGGQAVVLIENADVAGD